MLYYTIYRIFQLGARAFSDGVVGGFNTGASPANAISSTTKDVTNNEEDEASASAPGMTYPDFIYFMLSEEDKRMFIALLVSMC